MAGSPKGEEVVDTLVSNFYYCSLENLVRSEWTGSKGPLFPGDMFKILSSWEEENKCSKESCQDSLQFFRYTKTRERM